MNPLTLNICVATRGPGCIPSKSANVGGAEILGISTDGIACALTPKSSNKRPQQPRRLELFAKLFKREALYRNNSAQLQQGVHKTSTCCCLQSRTSIVSTRLTSRNLRVTDGSAVIRSGIAALSDLGVQRRNSDADLPGRL